MKMKLLGYYQGESSTDQKKILHAITAINIAKTAFTTTAKTLTASIA